MKRKAKRRSSDTRVSEQQLSSGFGTEMPPVAAHVKIYFSQKGMTDTEAEEFFAEYHKRRWMTALGTPLRNWKVLASNWIFESIQERKLWRRQSLFF